MLKAMMSARVSSRWLILALILVLAGGIWAVRGAWFTWQSQTALSEIQQRGELRVGMDASFPPFELLTAEGEVIGLDADIARALAADLGVEVVFVNIGFDGLYDALRIGRVDVVISALPIDPLLTRDVAYSVNYFNAGQVLLTRRANIESLADLAGETVAVEWGSMADLEARRLQAEIPGLEIAAQPDVPSALSADIALVDGVAALQASELRQVVFVSDEWYAAAVDFEARALLTAVNETLTRLRRPDEPPCYLAVPRTEFTPPDFLPACYVEAAVGE